MHVQIWQGDMVSQLHCYRQEESSDSFYISTLPALLAGHVFIDLVVDMGHMPGRCTQSGFAVTA